MKYTISLPILIALVLACAPPLLQAQPVPWNHPELDWQSLSTEHCEVHVHQGLDELGLVVADIVEDIWGPVTELYHYEPDTKLQVVFYDTDDYSNGGAYFYNNKLIIWATSLDFDLRGQHNWLRNVVTHEFTHIISLGAARKFSRLMPGLYLQVMDYEKEKRNDVLQGFPNVVASYPYLGTVVPMWFAEGTAQFQAEGAHYDYLDSQRDMLLRDRVIHDHFFPWNEINAFDKNTVGSESVYNTGFHLVSYINATYGPDALRRIMNELSKPLRISMDKAIRDAVGIGGRELYENWKRERSEYYDSHLANVLQNEVSGVRISASVPVSQGASGPEGRGDQLTSPRGGITEESLLPGSFIADWSGDQRGPSDEYGPGNNMYPVVSPDGRYVYYLSNGDADWLGQTGIWRYDREQHTREKVVSTARGAFCLSSDGKALIYSKLSSPDKYGSHLRDIFVYYIEQKLSRQLTEHQRLSQPALAADGHSLVCVKNGGGSSELVLLTLDDLSGEEYKAMSKRQRKNLSFLEPRALTHSSFGTQFYQPDWMPDGETVVVARNAFHGRDLVMVDAVSGEVRELLATDYDERTPQVVDGWLYYSQDLTGIYNIYRARITGSTLSDAECITNVPGGAFTPACYRDTLYFAEFRAGGFRLNELADFAAIPAEKTSYRQDVLEIIPPRKNDSAPTQRDYRPMGLVFEKPFIMPRVMIDDGVVKPGLYVLNTDLMERVSYSAALAVARVTNLDIYTGATWALGQFTWFGDLYVMHRDAINSFDDTYVILDEDEEGDPIFDTYSVDYRFYLYEAESGFRRRLNDTSTGEVGVRWSNYSARYKGKSHLTVNYDYLRGFGLFMRYHWEMDHSTRVDDYINPHNRSWLDLDYQQRMDEFMTEFEVTPSGLLAEVYDKYNFGQLDLRLGRNWSVPWWHSAAVGVDFRGSYVTQDDVDDFFYTYAGGLTGMKGYSYYSLGGTRSAVLHTNLGFPLIQRTGVRLGTLYFKRAYLNLFAGAGEAWCDEDRIDSDGAFINTGFDLKSEAGVDLKLALDSWNSMPTAITFTAAYGFDEFRVNELNENDMYGREWRWYLTVLFDFNTF